AVHPAAALSQAAVLRIANGLLPGRARARGICGGSASGLARLAGGRSDRKLLMDFTSNQIVTWLRQRATMATARGFVVGLSGGVDSAVVVGLCERAMPGQVVGLILPCGSDPRDEVDAQLVAD